MPKKIDSVFNNYIAFFTLLITLVGGIWHLSSKLASIDAKQEIASGILQRHELEIDDLQKDCGKRNGN